jgi:YVTN family beta-propeller protein
MKHQQGFTKRLIRSGWQFLVPLVAGIGLVASLWTGVALGDDSKKRAPLAYVTERDSVIEDSVEGPVSVKGSVSVIDTTTNQMVATVEVGPGPHGMDLTPDGKRGYVVNFGTFNLTTGNPESLDNTVSVIKTGIRTGHNHDDVDDSPKVIDTVEVGDGPLAVAVTPNGKYAYVTNFGTDNPDLIAQGFAKGNTISVIRTWDNKVVDTIEVDGTLPAGIAITPNGKRAYVPNRGSDAVSVIKIKYRRGKVINKVIDTVKVGHKPANVVITPDGKYAYVTNFGLPPDPPDFPFPGNTVSVIDTATNAVIKTIEVGFGPLGLAVTPKGDKVYVVNVVGVVDPQGNPTATVSVIDTEKVIDDTEKNEVVATIPVQSVPSLGPRAVAITPDGAHAYVTNFGLNTVEVIDTATDTIVNPVSTPGSGPNWVTISDAGRGKPSGHDQEGDDEDGLDAE